VEQRPHTSASRRSVAAPGALVVLPWLAYAGTVLVPYYSDARATQAGFFALLLAPLGAMLGLGGAVVQLVAAVQRGEFRRAPGVSAGLLMVAVLGVAVLAWFLSSPGGAVTTWQID
jgi:hypothetical protein